MEPIRIVEKKGNKYLVEWKGSTNKNTWETKANLGISYIQLSGENHIKVEYLREVIVDV